MNTGTFQGRCAAFGCPADRTQWGLRVELTLMYRLVLAALRRLSDRAAPDHRSSNRRPSRHTHRKGHPHE